MRTRRQVLSGILLTALAGCGFRPLYGQRGVSSGSVSQEFEQIRITPIADRTGQMLYNELRDRLNPRGRPASPRYVLSITLVERRENLAFRGDETATRANLYLTATYVLRHAVSQGGAPQSEMPQGEAAPDEAGGEAGLDDIVTRGEARIVTSYDILESQYATLVSIDDARARSVRSLGDDIQIRLATALSASSAS
jgi:LPS-assembly lipoprotein